MITLKFYFLLASFTWILLIYCNWRLWGKRWWRKTAIAITITATVAAFTATNATASTTLNAILFL